MRPMLHKVLPRLVDSNRESRDQLVEEKLPEGLPTRAGDAGTKSDFTTAVDEALEFGSGTGQSESQLAEGRRMAGTS